MKLNSSNLGLFLVATMIMINSSLVCAQAWWGKVGERRNVLVVTKKSKTVYGSPVPNSDGRIIGYKFDPTLSGRDGSGIFYDDHVVEISHANENRGTWKASIYSNGELSIRINDYEYTENQVKDFGELKGVDFISDADNLSKSSLLILGKKGIFSITGQDMLNLATGSVQNLSFKKLTTPSRGDSFVDFVRGGKGVLLVLSEKNISLIEADSGEKQSTIKIGDIIMNVDSFLYENRVEASSKETSTHEITRISSVNGDFVIDLNFILTQKNVKPEVSEYQITMDSSGTIKKVSLTDGDIALDEKGLDDINKKLKKGSKHSAAGSCEGMY